MDAQVAVWHPARVLAMEDAKAHASMSALADVKQGAEIHAKIHATVHLINYTNNEKGTATIATRFL